MPRKKLPEPEKRVGIAGRMLPNLVDALKAIGDADRRTFSFMLEEAVREYVERHGAKPAAPRPGTGPARR